MATGLGHGGTPAPGALHRLFRPSARDDLRGLSLVDLSTELLARLEAGEAFTSNEHAVLGEQLRQTLASALEIHENRFSARRYADLLRPILAHHTPDFFPGKSILDLGCGSLNPYGFSFLLLLLGAERAWAVDLDPMQDERAAVRALASLASWMLVEPSRVVGDIPLAPADVLARLRGFRLPLLAAGDPAGLAADRIAHRVESVYDWSLPPASVDAVFSVSVLEHLDRVDDALAALQRVTRPGGIGNHIIDFNDHRIYSGDVSSPFAFLTVASSKPLVYGCNRLRCHEFCERFERYGFAVERVETGGPYWKPLAEHERATFVEPFRSMSLEQLSAVGARIIVRRR